jgi:endoglycosylceramidase
MRRALGAALALAALAAPCAASPAPRGPLHPDGRWLKDRHGRVVIVHGLQLAHKSPPYHPPRASFGRADARLFRSLGLNAVRLAWFWAGLEPERGRYDRAYLAEIVRAGRLLAAQDVFLLVESHQDLYGPKVRGSGFPEWATRDDGAPLGPDMGFPGNYFSPATIRAFDNLWANADGIGDAYAAAWEVVARAFRRSPMLLGYDLFNEPWPGSRWPQCAQPLGCPDFDRDVLGPFQDALAAGVRRADPRGIVFYEPHLLFDFGAASGLPRPPEPVGPRGLSWHAYCLGDQGGAAGQGLCPAEDGVVFGNALATARAMDAVPLFSEFGDTDDRAAIERYLELADAHLMSWLYWGYKDWGDTPGGAGHGSLFADDTDNTTLDRAKAMLLSRPYPMAVAGVPEAYRFDPASGTFTLRYAPDRTVRAPTVVFVPRRRYRSGYAVAVAGARVTSRRHAPYLTLATRPRARTVRVTVTPSAAASARTAGGGSGGGAG